MAGRDAGRGLIAVVSRQLTLYTLIIVIGWILLRALLVLWWWERHGIYMLILHISIYLISKFSNQLIRWVYRSLSRSIRLRDEIAGVDLSSVYATMRFAATGDDSLHVARCTVSDRENGFDALMDIQTFRGPGLPCIKVAS